MARMSPAQSRVCKGHEALCQPLLPPAQLLHDLFPLQRADPRHLLPMVLPAKPMSPSRSNSGDVRKPPDLPPPRFLPGASRCRINSRNSNKSDRINSGSKSKSNDSRRRERSNGNSSNCKRRSGINSKRNSSSRQRKRSKICRGLL